MPIQRQEELERVGEKDLDGRIEQGDGEQTAVRADADRKDVVRHFERPRVH